MANSPLQMHGPSFLILKLNSRTEIFLAEIHLICQKLIGFIHLLDSLPNFKLKRIAPLWHHVTPCTHVTGKNIIFCQQTNNFAFDWGANISFLKREMFCSKLKPATFVFFLLFFLFQNLSAFFRGSCIYGSALTSTTLFGPLTVEPWLLLDSSKPFYKVYILPPPRLVCNLQLNMEKFSPVFGLLSTRNLLCKPDLSPIHNCILL